MQIAARGLLDVISANVTGILHFGGPQRLTRLEMGQRLAQFLGRSTDAIQPAVRDDVPASEPRPRDTSLNSERWWRLFPDLPQPEFEESLRMLEIG